MAHIKTRQLGTGGKAYQVRWVDAAHKERSKQFPRMTDARAFKTEVERALMLGTYVDPRAGDITFKAYAERWRAERIDHRPNTATRVKEDLERYAYQRIGSLRLGAARRADLQQWVTTLTHSLGRGRGLSPSTVRGVVATVRSVFARAVEDGLIARNPCSGLSLPQMDRTEVVIPSDEQLAAIADGFIASWYRRLVLVYAGTGLRSAELRGLTEDRVDWLRRTVKVDRQLHGIEDGEPTWGPPKTAAGYRTVPVAKCVIDLMAEQLAERGAGPQGLIFTNRDRKPIEQSAATKALTRVIEPVGWPRGTGFHLFRHYYASLLIHKGLSVKVVQKRLGHATVKETLDTYGHLWPDSDDDTREAIETTLGPIILGGLASPPEGPESVKRPAL